MERTTIKWLTVTRTISIQLQQQLSNIIRWIPLQQSAVEWILVKGATIECLTVLRTILNTFATTTTKMIISERGNYEIVISTRRNSNEPVNELLSNKYQYNTIIGWVSEKQASTNQGKNCLVLQIQLLLVSVWKLCTNIYLWLWWRSFLWTQAKHL